VLPDGRTLDATQIRYIMQGTRRSLDGMLVQRIAEVLDLDPAEAHYQAGTWPPDLNPEDLPKLSDLLATRRMMAANRVASQAEGARSAAPPVLADQQEPEILYLLNPVERPAA